MYVCISVLKNLFICLERQMDECIDKLNEIEGERADRGKEEREGGKDGRKERGRRRRENKLPRKA